VLCTEVGVIVRERSGDTVVVVDPDDNPVRLLERDVLAVSADVALNDSDAEAEVVTCCENVGVGVGGGVRVTVVVTVIDSVTLTESFVVLENVADIVRLALNERDNAPVSLDDAWAVSDDDTVAIKDDVCEVLDGVTMRIDDDCVYSGVDDALTL